MITSAVTDRHLTASDAAQPSWFHRPSITKYSHAHGYQWLMDNTSSFKSFVCGRCHYGLYYHSTERGVCHLNRDHDGRPIVLRDRDVCSRCLV